jgi:glycosyltransferase involved in cell wall biosynthesis
LLSDIRRQPADLIHEGTGGKPMLVAIVHDWLYTAGGAEKVLSAIIKCFPDADLFSIFDVLPPHERHLIDYKESRSSFLQRMPAISKLHRLYLPLMPFAIEQFDMSAYDLVISSSFAVAKGVLTGPDQLHISYVHSPMRYAWDLQHQYLRESGMTAGPKSMLARMLLHRLRMWDTRTANGVNIYAANSAFVARRIKKVYARDAEVIHPPVSVPPVLGRRAKEDFFVTASRLVPYKNIHQIVEAFRSLPDQNLIVVGAGPDSERLRRLSGSNVFMAGYVPDEELRALMGAARAFIFAAEEDFGIVPVEAQSEGTPVIALGRGGVRETIVGDGPSPTGLFFADATPAAITEAVREFITRESEFDPLACHANALRFSTEVFISEFKEFVSVHVAQAESDRQPPGWRRPPEPTFAGLRHGHARPAIPEHPQNPSAM